MSSAHVEIRLVVPVIRAFRNRPVPRLPAASNPYAAQDWNNSATRLARTFRHGIPEKVTQKGVKLLIECHPERERYLCESGTRTINRSARRAKGVKKSVPGDPPDWRFGPCC